MTGKGSSWPTTLCTQQAWNFSGATARGNSKPCPALSFAICCAKAEIRLAANKFPNLNGPLGVIGPRRLRVPIVERELADVFSVYTAKRRLVDPDFHAVIPLKVELADAELVAAHASRGRAFVAESSECIGPATWIGGAQAKNQDCVATVGYGAIHVQRLKNSRSV